MAHELLTGHVPFESVFDTGSAELMRDVVTNEPYDAPEDLPGYARRALAKALSKDPKDRFRSCAAFADALAGKGTPPEASDSPGIGAAPQPPVSKEDASRSRVEAKMHKLRFERLTEEPGFAGRRPLLEEAFLKGEMFFEAGLWGDAFRQFAGYVKEVEAFEKQAAERKAAAQMAAEEAERILKSVCRDCGGRGTSLLGRMGKAWAFVLGAAASSAVIGGAALLLALA